jgi:cytochrome c oxidase subunit I
MLLPAEVLGERSPETQRLFRAWVALATLLLTLSGLLLIPAAVGALTGQGAALASATIARLLVGHIFFSMVLACTAFVVVLWMLAALWLESSRFPGLPAWIGFWLAVAGSLLAAIGTLGRWGEPVLTEFVPVVVEPAFLSGFGLFMAGVAVTTGCFIYAVTGAQIARMPLVPYGMLCTAAMMIATGLAGVASITRLFGDWFAFQLAWRTPHILFQAIFWGPAHLIQFAVIGAMVVAWLVLLPEPGLTPGEERWGRVGFLAQVLFAAITLTVLYALDPLALPKMTSLNIAISYAQVLPVLFLAVLILRAAFRAGRRPGSALVLSMLLLAVGLAIAGVGAGQASPAWVPSHYQATVPGGVLLAFMGVTTALIPVLGRRRPGPRLVASQNALYSGGILVVSLAMLWAALLGGERRGYFVTMPATGPVRLLWIGGIAAELGLALFATSTLGALLRGAGRPAALPVGAPLPPIGRPAAPPERRA